VDAAAKYEPRVKRLFLRTAREARAAVPMADLEHVLSLGHPGTGAPLYVLEEALKVWERALLGDGVEAAPVDWFRAAAAAIQTDLPSILHQVLVSGARAGTPILKMAFDEANPEAIIWARRHAAKLVTDITSEARRAIRTVVAESFDKGMAPREQAKLIRLSIGLTERDAGAVMKRQLKMLADGINPRTATARAAKYADQLVRSRALTIARTETMRASNEGQMQLWRQAQAKGLLDATAQKVWLVADPCPICADLDGETVGINDSFSIGTDPPAHPNCKCTIGLV